MEAARGMLGTSEGQRSVGKRVILAPGSPVSPLHHAVGLALDWAARGRASISVLALHLSQMHVPGPRPHHRRVAAALLDGVVRAHGGQVFLCPNGDLVMMTDGAAATALIPTLSRLFRAEAPGMDRLLALWSLPGDEAAVRAYISAVATELPMPKDAPVPLGAMAAAEAVLMSVPLADLMRRQTAVRITGGGVVPLFQELMVPLAVLEAQAGAALPGMDDPFLSRHLAARLDRRVLDAVNRLPAGAALHLNLTLPGASSAVFQEVAAAMPRGGALGVELQFMEAVSDLPQFHAAAARLRLAGAALVLDGIDHAALLLARPEAFAPDLLKLDWSPRMAALPTREGRQLAAVIAGFGPERIVLHRAETEAAVAWGLQHGVSRFQGRHVDAMLAAERITACQHSAACTLRQCMDRAAATGPEGRSGCQDLALLDAASRRASLHPAPGA